MDLSTLIDPEIIAGTAAAFSLLYLKLRGRTVALRIKQTERLYSLLRNGSWQIAHPGSLQLAVEQAFGKLLDDRQICHALQRHDGLSMLRDSLRATQIVRWDAQTSTFVDDRFIKSISLRFWIVSAAVLLACLVTAGIGVVLLALLARNYEFAALIAIELFFIAYALANSCLSNAAAKRLLDPVRYPLFTNPPTSQDKQTTELPRKRRRIGGKARPERI